MDGHAGFSVLALFGWLSKHSPLSREHSFVSVVKFDVTLLVSILVTVILWGAIARLGSMFYIPLSLVLAALLTIGGIAITLIILLVLVSQTADHLEQYIRNALKERHVKHEVEKPRKLLLN
jgi:hypothetical protein